MSWEQNFVNKSYGGFQPELRPGNFGINKQCFIRKEHECGKIFGASKSCFIACPTSDNLEPILGLISEKLTKVGTEPIIAVKDRAYGQDIFCTKICGKIIESKFCLVILDDVIIDKENIPNPNVYYEYGLMTALRKHIIPLQKEGQKLAFNIQSYDTIKYNDRNITTEVDRALRDAIKISEAVNSPVETESMSEKTLLRRIEVSGLSAIGFMENEDLDNIINDTQFKGFLRRNTNNFVILGKIDTEEDFQIYFEDVDIIVYRIEAKLSSLVNKLASINNKYNEINQQIEKTNGRESTLVGRDRSRQADSLKRHGEELLIEIDQFSNIGLGFIIENKLNPKNFIQQVNDLIAQNERFMVGFSTDGELSLGEIHIDLRNH